MLSYINRQTYYNTFRRTLQMFFQLLDNKMDLQNKDDVNVNPLLLLLTLGVSLCFICHVNLTTCPTPWPLLTLRGKQRRGAILQ